MQNLTRRLLSLFLAAMLLLSVLQASAATASTIRLTKTTGTVSVTNASRRSVTARVNMLLYSGYAVRTRASSYAWLSLDSSKLAKLGASSQVEMRKSGSKLELLLKSGSIFFNVKTPLTSNETMNIRTSTMAVGIRGTCGWIKEIDEYTSELYLLEGTVQCTGADPASGEVKTETVHAGERVTVTVRPQSQEGQRCEISRGAFTVEDIDEYVMEELAADPELCEDIYDTSGLDILGTHEEEEREKAEAYSAYRAILDEIYADYGDPVQRSGSWDGQATYTGACGGYLANISGGVVPELITAYSSEDTYMPQSHIQIYTWNGTEAVLAEEYQVQGSGNGRSWTTYGLYRDENGYAFYTTFEYLPSYDYGSGTTYPGGSETTYYTLNGTNMQKTTPSSDAKDVSEIAIGAFDYILINNYSELYNNLK